LRVRLTDFAKITGLSQTTLPASAAIIADDAGSVVYEDKHMTPMEHLRAAMTAVDAYYKKQGIFQGKFGFGKKPALIVIDMAYGWTDAV